VVVVVAMIMMIPFQSWKFCHISFFDPTQFDPIVWNNEFYAMEFHFLQTPSMKAPLFLWIWKFFG
jgi:hypothetical protein